ncbi:MAG: aminotransferase class V-fold PLP-dependent enzyme [Deltaproteobacteria bacterium]|nr:aminotransferase class V-fold PLP-dependent enzyme [Deltaproteobacteria bacterium]
MEPVRGAPEAGRRARIDLGLYCDHNATAPMHPDVRAAVAEAEEALWGNPSSPHAAGAVARARLEDCRRELGALLDVDHRRVIFTSGATESNAQALQPGPRPVLASAVEHPSALSWAGQRVEVDADGVIDLEALDRALALAGAGARVALQAANNETGVLQPVVEAAAVCAARGARVHIDAAQLPGRCPLRPAAQSASSLALCAHKFGGPKGVGLLLVDPEVRPLLRGGAQERGLRPGTVPVPLIVGLTAALRRAEAAVQSGAPASLAADRDALEAAAVTLGGRPLAAGRPRLPNTTALLFDVDAEILVMALDMAGLCASTGAACSSGAAEQSHVLAAMGLRGRPLRLSVGPGLDLARATAALGALGAARAALADGGETLGAPPVDG